MPDWPGVFVSSTCHDLIDLRAELEIFLRDLGFTPLLSDRPSSEFETTGYTDSIETCLANVRKSGVFLCILSQRYGPRLGRVGFADVSATHLEYRAARDAGLPIHLYVRDRLDGDYATWRTNGRPADFRLPWIQKAEDFGLFELMEEHSSLLGPSLMTNWKWTFRDSAELRQRVAHDLKRQSATAVLTRLIKTGNLPYIVLSCGRTFRRESHYGVNLRV